MENVVPYGILDNPNSYTVGKYPKNLHQPFATWLQKQQQHTVRLLYPFFYFWISVLGYGNIATVVSQHYMY